MDVDMSNTTHPGDLLDAEVASDYPDTEVSSDDLDSGWVAVDGQDMSNNSAAGMSEDSDNQDMLPDDDSDADMSDESDIDAGMQELSIGERTLVIAIDFGTTFSKVAWAQSQKPGLVNTVAEWPNGSGEGHSSSQVPSRLRYLVDDAGNIEQYEWGYELPVDARADEIIQWFKLALEPELLPHDLHQTGLINLATHDVDKLLRDYLSSLLTHLYRLLSSHLGAQILATTPTRFVLTVPAMWSDRGKQRTVSALRHAASSFTPNPASTSSPAPIQVTVVSEPEAAATFALAKLTLFGSPHQFSPGQAVMVLDAGGGTVDLVCYEMTRLLPVLEVREAAAGSGGLCGSAFLNERFAAWLRGRLEGQPGFGPEVLKVALRDFDETIKRQFHLSALTTNATFPLRVPLPNNAPLRLHSGVMDITAADLHLVFEPVILQILKLVADQLGACTTSQPAAILLVGGFGGSVYLRERLEASIGHPRGIAVLPTEDASLAVVKGAVLKGLAVAQPERELVMRVKERRARKHYGTEMAVRWRAGEEGMDALKGKRYWDGLDGCWMVDTMNWFIKRGDPVTESSPYLKEVYFSSKIAYGQPQFVKLAIFADDFSAVAPLDASGPHVRVLCFVEADLSSIPDEDLDRRMGDDDFEYYNIKCYIEAVYGSASTEYTLIHKGKRYNTVRAEYV